MDPGVRGRWLIGFAVAAAVGAACHRTADEPIAAVKDVATSGAVSATPAASERCIAPTSESAPAAVAPGPAAGCPADPGPYKLDALTVRFPEAHEGATSVRAELARRPQDTERGLMYRTAMGPEEGMLFDLDSRKVQTFWMHNTCIPLDMLFIDDDGLVVGVLENVPPMNDTHRSVPCPSSHVLEMNAGWARRAGVRAGMHARLPGA
jgi:uncharacterized membrane protein (UPF0127 family)